jgi:FMN phosphatase YigB (HAD superfamily)
MPDVRLVVSTLRASSLRVAVVPKPGQIFETCLVALGIRRSSRCTRSRLCSDAEPDPRMYLYASDMFGLTPGECLYADDDPVLVTAAIQLGYRDASSD